MWIDAVLLQSVLALSGWCICAVGAAAATAVRVCRFVSRLGLEPDAVVLD